MNIKNNNNLCLARYMTIFHDDNYYLGYDKIAEKYQFINNCEKSVILINREEFKKDCDSIAKCYGIKGFNYFLLNELWTGYRLISETANDEQLSLFNQNNELIKEMIKEI